MARHMVVGAGGVGTATAKALAGLGHEVLLASRSGRDPHLAGVTAIALDAADAAALTAHAQGADSIVNAVNPRHYHRWARDWPPVANALLVAAERSGAGLVTVSNLYLYGRVDGPMTPSTPVRPNGAKGQVRARMWADALAAHEAGRIRATELRAGDYVGAGASNHQSLLNDYVIGPAATGRTVRVVVGDPDAPHSWSAIDDVARLAATLATDDRSAGPAWGRAWHVPSAEPRSQRQVAREAAALVGRPVPKVVTVPAPLLRLAGLVSPMIRELDETAHQFTRPFVLDADETTRVFGLVATPWEETLAATVRSRTAMSHRNQERGVGLGPATPAPKVSR